MDSQRDFELTHKAGVVEAGEEESSFENEGEGPLSASLSMPFSPSRRLLIKTGQLTSRVD